MLRNAGSKCVGTRACLAQEENAEADQYEVAGMPRSDYVQAVLRSEKAMKCRLSCYIDTLH